MTPSAIPHDALLDALAIRSNITHTRKLLITGDDLRSVADIQRGLLPLLPLNIDARVDATSSALELLPDLLARHGVRRDAVEAVIGAFAEQQSPAEQLHRLLIGEPTE
jgi:hypothetical protein